MIKFVYKRDSTCAGVLKTVPIITCDQCLQEITEARVARVAMQTGLRGELETGEPIFLHNACMGAFNRRLPNRTEEDFAAETVGWSADLLHWILLGDTWQSRFHWVSLQEWLRLLEGAIGADIAGYRAEVAVREQSMKESAGEAQRVHQLWQEGRALWVRMQEDDQTRLESSGE